MERATDGATELFVIAGVIIVARTAPAFGGVCGDPSRQRAGRARFAHRGACADLLERDRRRRPGLHECVG